MRSEEARQRIMKEIGAVKRVLIVRLSAFGDIVHSMHAVAGLRAALPGAHIGWLTGSRFAGLVRCAAFVNSVHLVDIGINPVGLIRSGMRLRQEVAGRYDLAVDVQGLLKSALAARISKAGVLGYAGEESREGAGVFYRWRVEPSQGATHVVEKQAELLSALAPVTPVRRLDLSAPAEEAARAKERFPWAEKGGYAVIHRCTRWSTKDLPAGLVRNLADSLQKDGWEVAATAPDDGEAAELKRILNGTSARIVRNLSFGELVWFLGNAGLFIGPDTGPTHLSSGLGVPTVAIYGPTEYERNGPYGPKAVCIRAPLDNCEPCWKRTCRRSAGPGDDCMARVTVEDVMKSVGQVLGGQR